ncbi:hypothetical protein NLJ89_g7466 [Agrocybe chaxingu]|uniref:Secreted protein n=1 Tax=Agrocybe chaxingu TaxID=84603 RepID=A0A9W8JWC0_9AGAR|nr:hypothetical protein NLJ89_g7466 [Agrocybe chaxingu]
MKLTSAFIFAAIFALKVASSSAAPCEGHNDIGHVHPRDVEADLRDIDARDFYDDLEERDFDDAEIDARVDLDDFEEVEARAIPPWARADRTAIAKYGGKFVNPSVSEPPRGTGYGGRGGRMPKHQQPLSEVKYPGGRATGFGRPGPNNVKQIGKVTTPGSVPKVIPGKAKPAPLKPTAAILAAKKLSRTTLGASRRGRRV